MGVTYSDVSEGGVAVNCEKTQFFLNTLLLPQARGLALYIIVYKVICGDMLDINPD